MKPAYMKRLGEDKLPEGGNKRWTQTEEPCWEDFAEDLIPLPKDLPKTILKLLEEGFCTIAGPKNTGKTWLCYGVGFELEKEKKPVWYIDDKDFKVDPVMEYVKEYIEKPGETCYLIVEDCHKNSEETEKLLKESRQIGKGNLRVLFTTEETEEYILKDVSKIKLPDDLPEGNEKYAKNIIEKFLEIEKLRKYVGVEDIENTAKRSAKNLSQLSQCLKTWVREKYFEKGRKLSEIIEKIEEKQLRELFEKIPHFESIEKKIEENIKFPTKEDFDNGLVYSDEISKEVVKKVLESKRFCLLYGVPASRKTTFSLDFGLDLFNQGYSVGYFEIEDKPNINWSDLLQEVKSCGSEKTLFIIDDCHKLSNDEKLVRDFCRFIQGIKRETNAKFLFVSRDISQEIMDPELNYFDKLKNLVKLTTNEEVFEGIIERFCIHHKIENWKEQIEEVNKIKEEICGNNILILNLLLKTWGKILREDPKKILSEVEKREIYKKVSAKYHFIEKEKEYEDFFKLCAIYQFEIPIHHDFIRNEKIKRESLNTWEHEGLIYRKIPEAGGVYYTVHDNSSFARLFLKTGDYLEILILDGCKHQLEEYIAEVLKRFLVKGKVDIAQVLSTIHENRYSLQEDGTIGNRLIQNKEILGKIKKYFSLVGNFMLKIKLLKFLRHSGIKQTDIDEILDKSILSTCAKQIRTVYLIQIFLFLHNLASFQPEKAREFLDLITAKGLAEIYKERFKKKDLFSIAVEFEDDLNNGIISGKLQDIFKAKGFPISENAMVTKDKEDIWVITDGEKIYIVKKEDGKLNIYKKINYTIMQLRHIRKISAKLQNEEFWQNFLNQFTEEEIVNLLNNSHHRQIYEFFQKRLSTNARQAYRIFLDQYTEEEILSQLNSLDLKQIGEFVHISYWHRTVKKAYEKFFVDFLPGKINKASLEDIIKFIFIIRRTKWKRAPLIGNKLSIQVINNLSEEFIRQKLEESSLKGIQSFIRMSKEVNRSELLKLIKSLDQSKLKGKIRESNINDIGYFIWNISDGLSLPVEYSEIITDLDLTEKIRKSPLKDVNFFLWVLFQTVGESQKVFSEDTLINNLKRDDVSIGDTLWLVGICDFANHDLASRAIKTSKLQATLLESEVEFKNWLEKGRFSKKSPFKVALVLKGFKAVDEEVAFSFLNDHFELKEEIINNLKKAEIKNEKSEELINEVLGWLLSQEVTKNRKRSVLESSSNSIEGESE